MESPLIPLILHVPHASRTIPAELRDQFLLPPGELEDELTRMTDAHTDRLFACDAPGCTSLIHPVSRLVVDPERFAADEDEPMARVGMGVVYTRTAAGAPLRRPLAPAEREALLARYYRPHHARLDELAAAALEAHGRCLVVDCHSFPSVPLPYETDQDPDRPAICIGTDPVHTPRSLVDGLVRFFEANSLSVALDRPFAGTMVPARFLGTESRVSSVMIEVNRGLYMDEATGAVGARWGEVREFVRGAVEGLRSSAGAG